MMHSLIALSTLVLEEACTLQLLICFTGILSPEMVTRRQEFKPTDLFIGAALDVWRCDSARLLEGLFSHSSEVCTATFTPRVSVS
mmetsp:Transcript_3203/g.7062  ORF Transcript_3203/g.7062 Transcript_3203/m.7062 type:complete len:85 (+) Transcript_3203:1345-1599(+)